MILLLALINKPRTIEEASKLAITGTLLDIFIFTVLFFDKIIDKIF